MELNIDEYYRSGTLDRAELTEAVRVFVQDGGDFEVGAVCHN